MDQLVAEDEGSAGREGGMWMNFSASRGGVVSSEQSYGFVSKTDCIKATTTDFQEQCSDLTAVRLRLDGWSRGF